MAPQAESEKWWINLKRDMTIYKTKLQDAMLFFVMKHAIVSVVFIVTVMPPAMGRCQTEGDSDTIVLGMSTALSGQASFLGQNMKAGVMAALNEANNQGGIHSKRIEMVCLDDGYEPTLTAPNMRKLINEYKVIAVIGNVGTPTAVTAIPIANETKTPFFGAFTGADILRKTPPDRYVINYRAGYAEEVSATIKALIRYGGLKPHEIAFFTQRDAYGDAGFSGGIEALKENGLTNKNMIIHSRYERNTLAVENGLADIILADPNPKAVVMVGTYAPCARFIKLAEKHGLDAIFSNVSFVGTRPLAASLGKNGDGVIITQVVPHFNSNLPVVRDYRAAIKAYNPALDYSFSSLEGYIVSRILLLALSTINGSITRESVVDALEGLGKFDIGLGHVLELGKNDHQACHHIWPTILHSGKAIPYRWQKGL